jgi:anti-anti-sigma factor
VNFKQGGALELDYTINAEQWKEKVCVLRLSGQLDKAFQPEMDDAIQSAIDGGLRNFAVDLSGLEYMSSAGIASLVNLRGKLDRVTGDICFFAQNGRVNKVLEVMGIKRACTFYDDENTARQAFRSGA